MNTATASSGSSGNTLPLIDVLRGLASFWVVLFHSRVDLWVGFREMQGGLPEATLFDRLISWLSVPMAFGGSGVMLFFVLSGFCVHLPLAGGGSPDWKTYGARRFLRIFPPYMAAILLTLACEFVVRWINPTAGVSSAGTIFRSLFMVQNYGETAGQLVGNPSLWSLPVEMELYVAYPLFLWLLRRTGTVKAFAVVATVSAVSSVFGGRFPALNAGFAPYWLIWCVGALLAERWKTGGIARPGLAYYSFMGVVFLIAAVFTWRGYAHWIACHFWAAGYALLLWIILSKPSLASSVPGGLLRPLVFLGTISYSLYLVHFPFFRLMGEAWNAWSGSKPINLLVPLTASVLVVPLAALFYRLVEGPSHHLARRLGKRLKPSTSG